MVVALDRDERVEQVGMEMLLTLCANEYTEPEGAVPMSPRIARSRMRSLAIGENFATGTSDELTGGKLASGIDFLDSENLGLMQRSLRPLVDPGTLRGAAGVHLMLPVHEGLLWYDARARTEKGQSMPHRPQFVKMRGAGIALARFLLAPPAYLADFNRKAEEARREIKDALQAPSPLAELSASLKDSTGFEPMSSSELSHWEAADDERLFALGRRLIDHAHAIMTDATRPAQVRLLDLRRIVALDFAWHLLDRAGTESETEPERRALVLCHDPRPRPENRIRRISEDSFKQGVAVLHRGFVAAIAQSMWQWAVSEREWTTEEERWAAFFAVRNRSEAGQPKTAHARYIDRLITDLARDPEVDFEGYAARAFEAPGDGFDRPVDSMRIMLESCGALAGGSAFRYFRASPALLGALVAARPQQGMQEADDFLAWLAEEWSMVIGEQEGAGAGLRGEGSALQRNYEHFEQDLVRSGLAVALSDQTCMVGRSVDI